MLRPDDFDSIEQFFDYADSMFPVYPPNDLLWVDVLLWELVEENVLTMRECENLQISLLGA